MNKASIKDVAKLAGVSATTVSYVLNNKPSQTISKKTKDKVFKAAKTLNYIPNLNARSLASKKTNLIGVVIPQTEPGKEFMFSNPFYGELLSSIEYTARLNGFHILISGTAENQSYINIAKNRVMDGIIFVGLFPGEELETLKGYNVPKVLVDSYVNDDAFHTIGIDDELGGQLATEYLIKNGHKDIAFVSGALIDNGVNSMRYSGYCKAMENAGLKIKKEAVYTGSVDFDYGISVAQEMCKKGCKETAAFITADVLAIGLIKGFYQMGKSVPEDISVVGFDNVYLSQMSYPSLTTIRQDISQKGREAVALIIESLKNKDFENKNITLPISLVTRDSVIRKE
ncbi:MAG: LacI family transcriptional regulator [Christensenellaceae bacterium]|nr:LacI family transcriptional regulator [Christensenellaceae bacterium]